MGSIGAERRLGVGYRGFRGCGGLTRFSSNPELPPPWPPLFGLCFLFFSLWSSLPNGLSRGRISKLPNCLLLVICVCIQDGVQTEPLCEKPLRMTVCNVERFMSNNRRLGPRTKRKNPRSAIKLGRLRGA